MASFAQRLAQAMKERGITQTELAAVSGIPKSAINQYLSDKFKPKQSRTYLLASALDVEPVWLMGYTEDEAPEPQLSEKEQKLIDAYRTNTDFRAYVNKRLELLDEAPIERVFRAAKSKDGTIAPAIEEFPLVRLNILDEAPETDEDL